VQILSVIQRFAKVVGMAVPEAVFASDGRSEQEFAALACQMSERIADEHDWQRLRRKATITGDGVTTSWTLPADFSRMPSNVSLRDSTGPLQRVLDPNVWLDWGLRSWAPAPGAWTLLGDRIEIMPALADGRVVQYYYQSDKIVRSDGTAANSSFPYTLNFELADSGEYGTALPGFVSDGDHFQLDWKILELGMIWQWRANKGMPYAEDMQTYELMKAKVIMRERGPRVLVGPRNASWLDDTEIAYPWMLPG
jgi:hypothetical protein